MLLLDEDPRHLHVAQSLVHFLVAPSSLRIVSQCVRSSKDCYPLFLQPFQHTATVSVSNLLTFSPDMSNCEFRGLVDTDPQVRSSRFKYGVIPLGQSHNRRRSRVLGSREMLTRVFAPGELASSPALQRSDLPAAKHFLLGTSPSQHSHQHMIWEGHSL